MDIMLREISQTQKGRFCGFPLTGSMRMHSQKAKCGGWGLGWVMGTQLQVRVTERLCGWVLWWFATELCKMVKMNFVTYVLLP
jgi:hypothetical protein